MTVPKSPIMGQTALSKSPEREEKESLASAMVKDIKAEKERGIEQSPLLERTIVQAGVDFDRRYEEAAVRERDTVKWPPAMVYGITPQTSSGEESHKHYRETPMSLTMGPVPKSCNPLLYLQVLYKVHQHFVVPAKKAFTQVNESDKESISGRAPLLLTPAFEEVKVEKPMVRADILTPTKLTKDGNPAVIVKTDSWYDAYKTQFFAVDKVNGTIYAIKEDGQWEPTEEIPTIDAETHHILMSTTPLAGNKVGRQSLSTGVTPGNKAEDSLPLAESTRTPGHQRIYPRDKDLTASAQRKRTTDNLSGQIMRLN